jgi:DNA gyrase/topoisomerase IV subunit B
MIIKTLLLTFFFYVLYKFVFGFILPVYKTTKKVRNQFSDMQKKMQEQFGQYNNTQQESTVEKEMPKKKPSKEYIDFEDVS